MGRRHGAGLERCGCRAFSRAGNGDATEAEEHRGRGEGRGGKHLCLDPAPAQTSREAFHVGEIECPPRPAGAARGAETPRIDPRAFSRCRSRAVSRAFAYRPAELLTWVRANRARSMSSASTKIGPGEPAVWNWNAIAARARNSTARMNQRLSSMKVARG